LVVTQAPTSNAQVSVVCGTASHGFTATDTLASSSAITDGSTDGVVAAVGAAGTASCTLGLGTNPASGSYAGTLTYASGTNTGAVAFSFTTAGKVASISASESSVSLPSVVKTDTTHFVTYKTVTYTLKDTNGVITQPALGDSISVTASGSLASVGLQKVVDSSTIGTTFTYSDTDMNSGTFSTVVGSYTATAGTSTITATPAGIMPAQGVAALSYTATTVAYGDVTNADATVTAPTSSTVIKSVTGTPASYNSDPSVTSYTFAVSGLVGGSAYAIGAVSDDGGVQTVADDVSNTTAVTLDTSEQYLYGIVPSSGIVYVTVSGAIANNKFIKIDGNGDGDFADASDAVVTAATSAYVVTVTSPTADQLAVTSSALAFTGKVADQYGNVVPGASVTLTGTSTPSGYNKTITAVSGSAGTWTATLPAADATTTSISVVASAAKTGIGSISSASALVTYFTASGIASTLTLTDNDTIATGVTQTDNISTRAVLVAGGSANAGAGTYLAATAGGATTNVVDITVATTSPSAIAFSATATNGIRLFTSDPGSAALTAGDTTVTGTGGTTHIYAVPTKVGQGTITVTSGGLSKVFTLTGALAASPKAQLVTLTAGTNANGKAAYTVTTTDVFGNAVAGDVNITMSGAGYLSNGFKNMTVTTLADGTNSFDVISDGSSASGITATIASGSYQAVSAAQATAQSISASDVDTTASVTVAQPAVATVTLTTVNTAATAAGTKADAATAAATTAGDKADAAKTEAAKATTAATTAGDKADAAKTSADAATTAATAAGTEAAKATAQAAANATAIAALTALVEKLIADKAASDKTTAAAIAANASAIQDVLDIATDASSNAADAIDAANLAAEAADAATAAAQDVADAVAAVAEQVTAAQDISTEATEAANAATDAANAAAEAADNAGSVAQEAVDAANEAVASVTALGTQLATFAASVKAQITTLTNLVVKIQKKVKA